MNLFPVLAPLITFLIAQFGKLATGSMTTKNLTRYGGMPSSHSATVTALVVVAFLDQGWTSFEFAFAVVFAIIVIRDALGLRQYLAANNHITKILAEKSKDPEITSHVPALRDYIGHSIPEVLVGIAIGIVVTLGLWFAL